MSIPLDLTLEWSNVLSPLSSVKKWRECSSVLLSTLRTTYVCTYVFYDARTLLKEFIVRETTLCVEKQANSIVAALYSRCAQINSRLDICT